MQINESANQKAEWKKKDSGWMDIKTRLIHMFSIRD